MTPSARPLAPLRRGEFIALIAMLFASIALSVDAMLPAMPLIAEQLSPEAPNRAQLIIGIFILGMGIGTLFTGPLSDAWGRKAVIIGGAVIYCLASLACFFANSLELMLLARLFQGLGAAAPRTVAIALVRDQYRGREMAQIMSYAMMIFTMVPAMAPMLGMAVMSVTDWHVIFLIYVLFGLTSILWLGLRQPETNPAGNRKPLSIASLVAAGREMAKHRISWLSILLQSLIISALFSTILSIQQIFEQHFGFGDSFPFWFCGIAVVAGSGSVLNARLVMRLGMRRMIVTTLSVVFTLSLLHLALQWGQVFSGTAEFAVYLIWQVTIFGMMGLTMGNLNALAMEPLGRIAGFASSVISASSTVLSVLIAMPIGQAFNGTPVPLIFGATLCTGVALLLSRALAK